MHAASADIDVLFAATVPDPDRPTHLAAGVAEMHLAEFTDGPVESGVWTCSVGAWDETDTEVDEVMVILEGRVEITDVDGTVHDVGPGQLLHVPKGWSGRWNVVEPLKKLWFIASG